jgi:hypothetical protein
MVSSPKELGPEKDCAGKASSTERAPHKNKTVTVTQLINIWSQAPNGCFVPRQTGRLTVVCNITLTLSGGWSPNWVHSARRPLNGLLYLPLVIMLMENLVEWRFVRGNRSTRRKPAPAPLCPPKIPLYQTRVWTRAAAVGSQRLTAWAMARPSAFQKLVYL